MSEDEFEAMLDRHGGEVAAWPAARRQAAATLLAGSAAARVLLAETAALERMLRADIPAEDSVAAKRMAARAMLAPQASPRGLAGLLRPRDPRSGRLGRLGSPPLRLGSAPLRLGLAAALVLAAGVAAGLAIGGHRATADGLEEARLEAPAQLVAGALGIGEAASDVD